MFLSDILSLTFSLPPIDANPGAGELEMLRLSASRAADEFGFVCFVAHWAPFSYTDCLNTPLLMISASILSSWRGEKKLNIFIAF